MNRQTDTPGSAVVGCLTEIPPWEAELILSMRLWMDGREGQAEVWNGYVRCFGERDGRTEMRRFETLLTFLCATSRRPLVRHGFGCVCIGADEAVLRVLVREATRGDVAEATLIASLLVPVRHADPIVRIAAPVGRAMQQITGSLKDLSGTTPQPDIRRLH